MSSIKSYYMQNTKVTEDVGLFHWALYALIQDIIYLFYHIAIEFNMF